MLDKAMVQMQQTGIINENAWLPFGRFENTVESDTIRRTSPTAVY